MRNLIVSTAVLGVLLAAPAAHASQLSVANGTLSYVDTDANALSRSASGHSAPARAR